MHKYTPMHAQAHTRAHTRTHNHTNSLTHLLQAAPSRLLLSTPFLTPLLASNPLGLSCHRIQGANKIHEPHARLMRAVYEQLAFAVYLHLIHLCVCLCCVFVLSLALSRPFLNLTYGVSPSLHNCPQFPSPSPSPSLLSLKGEKERRVRGERQRERRGRGECGKEGTRMRGRLAQERGQHREERVRGGMDEGGIVRVGRKCCQHPRRVQRYHTHLAKETQYKAKET